jgi:hypothetical protein
LDKVDPAILTAVAARIAAMKFGVQAALLLPEKKDTDPIVAQARGGVAADGVQR